MNVSKGSKKAEDKNFYGEIRLWHKSRNHENTGVVKGYAISLILPPHFHQRHEGQNRR